jgi:hypothetical protein
MHYLFATIVGKYTGRGLLNYLTKKNDFPKQAYTPWETLETKGMCRSSK